ncbi:ABC transporter ATP-binding protein [Haloferax larsenii]|uniref:ABC-2 type transport system ATP-binding protein n=1 Tax=Haloferax larsenii TaxID=302484 RepID=A0A1H7TM25_HALLR|nr:ABC transporter ATP-binding protein [Haloferax larsenii]SEL85406.1 ABC-2 type transport system ATP-binding protein [Haloferax larsenii]
MTAVELQNVSKRYSGTTAISDLSLSVERGEVFGFLGPNGAGKSTTIDILLNYIRPTSGSVEILGKDVRRNPVVVKKRVGVLPDQYAVFERLTGRKHVEFAIRSKGADDDPTDLLERVNLSSAADRPATSYSKGMKQRLMLAMGLVGSPDLLVLDEPSTGLDPLGVRVMRTIVREERERGATVFFSSHILEQVEAVCDRVGILNEGSLVALDSMDGLREAVGASSQLTVTLDRVTDGVLDELDAVDGVTAVDADGASLVVTCENTAKASVIDAVRVDGNTVQNITTDEPSLEDLFVSYTTEEP